MSTETEKRKIKAYVVLSIGDLKDMIKLVKKNCPSGKPVKTYQTRVFHAEVHIDRYGEWQISSVDLAHGRIVES